MNKDIKFEVIRTTCKTLCMQCSKDVCPLYRQAQETGVSENKTAHRKSGIDKFKRVLQSLLCCSEAFIPSIAIMLATGKWVGPITMLDLCLVSGEPGAIGFISLLIFGTCLSATLFIYYLVVDVLCIKK